MTVCDGIGVKKYGGLLKKVHLWYSLRVAAGEHDEFLNQNGLGIIRLIICQDKIKKIIFIACKSNYLLFYLYHKKQVFNIYVFTI